MGLFDLNSQSPSVYAQEAMTKEAYSLGKKRTFRERTQDQIAYHQSQIDNLQAVLDSMTPEVEKFVEAVQKASL